jgi:large subunit ribosomal protein L15
MATKLKVTLVRSGINRPEPHKLTAAKLGLGKLGANRGTAGQSRGARDDPIDFAPCESRIGGVGNAQDFRKGPDMGTTLHDLKGPRGATRNRKRIGRGPGSGTGEQSGKGVKGQKARTGHHGARFGFEGGQMPMQRRLPKKGFKNIFRKEIFAVNLSDIDVRFEAGTVTIEELKVVGLVPRRCDCIKILGGGELTKKFVVKADAFSASAKEKIEKKGGRAELANG